MAADQVIDRADLFRDAVEKLLREGIRKRLCRRVFADQQRSVIAADDFIERSAAKVPLEEHLQRLFPCFVTCH